MTPAFLTLCGAVVCLSITAGNEASCILAVAAALICLLNRTDR